MNAGRLMYLGAAIVREIYRHGNFASARVLAALGLGLLVIPHISTEIGGYHQMWGDRRIRLAGKACTQLINLFPAPQGVFMIPTVLMDKDFLDELTPVSLVIERGENFSSSMHTLLTQSAAARVSGRALAERA